MITNGIFRRFVYRFITDENTRKWLDKYYFISPKRNILFLTLFIYLLIGILASECIILVLSNVSPQCDVEETKMGPAIRFSMEVFAVIVGLVMSFFYIKKQPFYGFLSIAGYSFVLTQLSFLIQVGPSANPRQLTLRAIYDVIHNYYLICF